MSTQIINYRHTFPSLLGRGVFDDFFGAVFSDMNQAVRQSTTGYPVADIFKIEDGSTVMEFALAGFSRGDINVEVKPETRSITVSAEITEDTAIVEGSTPNSRRIARRNFSKTYVNYDDNLDLASASAKFENGLLTIEVPPRPEVQPVQIKIR